MQTTIPRLALVSGILILAGFATPTTASFIDANGRIIEGFENATFPDQPVSDHYIRTTLGNAGVAQLDSTTAATGTQSYKLDGTTAGGIIYSAFDLQGLNLCADAEEIGSTRHIDFSVRNNEANGAWGVRLTNAARGDYALMEGINSGAGLGVWVAFNNNAGNAQSGTAVFANTVDTTWTNYSIRCGNLSATFCDLTAVVCNTQSLGSGTFTPTILEVYSAGASTGGFTLGNNVPPAVNFDDISFGHPLTPGLRFCANPTTANFDYSYVEDWTYETGLGPGQGITTDDGFVAIMPTTDTAFMGKGFTVGSQAFRTVFRIEAGIEGSDGLFGVAYTTGAGGVPSGANKGTGLEDTGFDGGNFDNSYQAVFQEDGNDWSIKIIESVAGVQTQLGGLVLHGDPNTPTTYQFVVNSQTQEATILNGAGDVIFTRSAGQFTTTNYKDQWFGATSYLTTLIDPTTVLDDADPDENGVAGEDSTCIYDLIGNSEVDGSSGLEPVDDDTNNPPGECTSFLCVDSTTVPEGFTASTFNLFLGVLLMLAIGVGVFMWTKSTVMGLGGLTAGFLISFAFGLIPLWIIVVLVIVSVAIIFVRTKGALGGTGG